MQNLFRIAIFLVLGVHHGQAQNCTFPSYVQNKPDDVDDHWVFHATISSHHVIMTFHDNQWVAREGDAVLINSTCINSYDDDSDGWSEIFLTNSTEGDDSLRSMCLQFIKRTDNVVQFKTGKANDSGDVIDCDAEQVLVDWPLVAKQRRTQKYERCPLEGGYDLFNITGTYGQSTEEICKKFPLHGLVESECTVGEGLWFTFTDYTCIPKYTGWGIEQPLYCLDSWKDEDDTQFTILGRDYDSPQFCMRVGDGEFVIFQDMVCAPGTPDNTTSYITMDYVQKGQSFDTCQDEKHMDCSSLEFCERTPFSLSCKKSCSQCYNKTSQCRYDPSVVPAAGEWVMERDLELHVSVSTNFTFTNNSFNITNFSQFHCHEKVLDDTYVNHLGVVSGCSPRYSCSKFAKVSESVLQYKFSQFKRDYTHSSELCSDSNFHDDSPPLNNIIRSRDFNILIATDPIRLNQTVDCSFRGNYTFNMSLHYNTIHCNGTLSDLDRTCGSQNSVSIDANCQGEQHLQDYPCLGTLDFGSASTSALITLAADTDAAIGHCWIFKSAETDSDPLQFYVLNSPQCDITTLDAIELGDRHAEACVAANRVDSCDDPPAPEVSSTPTTISDSSQETDTEATIYVTSDVTAEVTSDDVTAKITSEVTDDVIGQSTSLVTRADGDNIQTTKGPATGPTAGEVIGILIGVIAGCLLVSVIIWLGVKEYRKRRTPYRVL